MLPTHSLIISTYNRPDALALVLESVIKQRITVDEIIIADDGSGEDTRNTILSYKDVLPKLQHVWHEDKGFRLAAIRNKAINASTCSFISMIDGDMVLHPDFISDIKNHIKENYFLQGKRVLMSSDTTQKLIRREIDFVHFLSDGIVNRFNTLSIPLLSKVVSRKYNSIKSVKGCSMHFWKENAERVNGFNEAFIGWGREDSEFLARMLNAGVQRKNIVLGAVAFHLYHKEEPREMLKENDEILAETIRLKKVWCSDGLE
jgi:glycosyltransferase involved in cell wall biosynthesis